MDLNKIKNKIQEQAKEEASNYMTIDGFKIRITDESPSSPVDVTSAIKNEQKKG